MKTNNTLKNLINASFILAITLATGFQSSAQGLKEFAKKYQVGLEASFGVKSFGVSSNIDKIDGLHVTEEGGAIGIVAGSEVVKLRIKQGFYYSSAAVTQTVDEIRSSVNANIYPLDLIFDNARLAPYLTMGMERNLFKMYGFYGNEATSQRPNYSVSEAPFLGKISTVQASVGAGMEYRVRIPGHFVNFFGEARYGKNIKTTTSAALFNATSFSDQMAITVGICYGYGK